MSKNIVKVKELFTSIQGEGPYVGYKQLFIRFCNCNLKCKYCDTDFSSIANYTEYSAEELSFEANKFLDVHSVSLTGGEPLLEVEFFKEFLPLLNKKVYLETNATLVENFKEVKNLIDIVAADIKLESATGIKEAYNLHDKFFSECKDVETFAKIVFNSEINDFEIKKSSELAKKYSIPIVLQPEMVENKMNVSADFCANILDKFLAEYEDVRLIPQVHKFIDVR